MKTWLTLLLSLLLANTLIAQPSLKWQDGVLIQKVGQSIIYIFPSTEGRVTAIENPAGVITIGSTITISYALKVVSIGKARFIGLDASAITAKALEAANPRLKVVKADKLFGFLLRDTKVPTLEIHIAPSFMENKVTQEEKIVRQGNLSVTIGQVNGQLKILNAWLD